MKAQRRHDLQTNSLAKVISGGPSNYGRFGGRILLVVLVALVVFFLVRYRISSSRESARLARENLSAARSIISNLHFADLLNAPPTEAASLRRRWTAEVSTALEEAARLSDEPEILAEILLARGDLNWALSTLTDIPGAATQPTLRMEQTKEELIIGAAESYTGVLNEYPGDTAAVIGARFGLAAVAENRGNWDEARQQYQAIIDNTAVAEAYRGQARLRVERATEWSKPVLLAEPTSQPSTDRTGIPFVTPTTAPSTTSATTTATTRPPP
jgi:hypothetical protein